MTDRWYQDKDGYIVCGNCFRKYRNSRDTELRTFILLQNLKPGEQVAFKVTEENRERIRNKLQCTASYIKRKLGKVFIVNIDHKESCFWVGRKE